MRRFGWLTVLVIAWGCAKAERAAEPAPGGQASPPPATPVAPAPPAAQTPATPSEDQPSTATSRRPQSATDEDKRDGMEKEALRGVQTVDQAEAALKQAQTDLDSLLGPAARGRKGGATALSAGDSRCPNACKAFGSLRRAADAVCRLAGDSDTRCARARTIVKDNESKLSACKCEPAKD